MVEIIKGKLLTGPALALVGSILLLIGGILGSSLPDIQLLMANFPILYVTFVLPIILGAVGTVGTILTIIDKKNCKYIILVIGLVAVIGLFIPILTLYPLVMSFLYIDPFLILIGGILSVVIRE
ncbi:MAG: hypothetical protein ACFFE4_04120 [Candidatus Thorarchaeota archaeon]